MCLGTPVLPILGKLCREHPDVLEHLGCQISGRADLRCSKGTTQNLEIAEICDVDHADQLGGFHLTWWFNYVQLTKSANMGNLY